MSTRIIVKLSTAVVVLRKASHEGRPSPFRVQAHTQ